MLTVTHYPRVHCVVTGIAPAKVAAIVQSGLRASAGHLVVDPDGTGARPKVCLQPASRAHACKKTWVSLR